MQHKRIPAAVQNYSRSTSQHSVLQLEYKATETYSFRRPNRQQYYIIAQCITIAVTSKSNVFPPQSRMVTDLYHCAVHYNCSNKRHNKYLPPSRPAAVLYYSAVHFNCSNKQHKRIPAAVQTCNSINYSAVHYNCCNTQQKPFPAAVQISSTYTSQRSSLHLQ